VLADASQHAASLGMTGRLCLREEQIAVVNDALSPSGDEVAWALDVLDTLERCGIRDGSDLPRIARARAICDAAVAFGIEVDAAAVHVSDYRS
jgi:citrate lyase subunit beta/citryl-CoA lyase